MIGNPLVIWPLACLTGGAFVVYLIARLLTRHNSILALCTALVFGLALLPLIALGWSGVAETEIAGQGQPAPVPAARLALGGGWLRAEPAAVALSSVAVGLGVLVALYSGRYLALDRRYETYYPLLLLLVTGLVGMVQADDLFTLYMFCELMSISAYSLVAFRRYTDTAIEAGFKYLVMGTVGTAVVLLGISFIYRGSGGLTIAPVASVGDVPWVAVGLVCFVVGFGVKSAVVPLHAWLPDAHGRAPSSVSAMLSGIVIQSALYVLLKTTLGLGFPAQRLGTLLVLLSLLNMTLGNVLALVQHNTKRLLAYSSIAQLGYMMFAFGIGLRHGIQGAVQAGLFLLLAHAAMKGLAFLSKGVCHFYCHTTDVIELRGTAQQLPLVAVTMGIALAGLAGIPPLAGFAGKWLIVAQTTLAADALAWVGMVILMLNGMLGLGYYLPLIGTLFTHLGDGGDGVPVRIGISLWMGIPLIMLGGLVLAISVYPGPWLGWLAQASSYVLALGGS